MTKTCVKKPSLNGLYKNIVSRHKASNSKTIESSIPATKEQTNVKHTTVDGVAPSTPAKSQLNKFFSACEQPHPTTCSSSTPARSFGDLEHATACQGFAEAPQAQIIRISSAQDAISA